MVKPQIGLGRGLGELFVNTTEANAEPDSTGPRFDEVPLAEIKPNPKQPRQVFAQEEMDELVASIKEIGVLQPVVVRPLSAGGYELVMGERRWRASKQAGLERIPAIVRETEESDMLRDALLENLHRAQLNPLEEAAAYAQMLTDFDCTQDELSSRIKRSRPHIANTIRLLKLPPAVQKRVAAGVLSAGHARALLTLSDPAEQERYALKAVAEGLSVRSLEEAVSMGEGKREKPQTKSRDARPVASPDPRADALADYLETRVTIIPGKTRSRVSIDFADEADLQRIIDLIISN